LRAVQFGEIRPVGSDVVRRVDVRIVAATHRDLRAKVQDQSFREDLFYRLAVLELPVPPLRERPEDIPALAAAFLQREAQRSGRPLVFADAARKRLAQHEWPGNVRELENAVVRLGVLVDGPEITVADVEDHVLRHLGTAPAGSLPTLDLGSLEQLAITAALRRSGGNKTKAAQLLGIALKTLYNKLAARGEASSDPDAERPKDP
ncbi:MAG: sigma-54-dependent Fis family transcriptional regulator, partial [Planctomycetes bacterium]|nr:sigma-54-dependent Fis family transcriptional regulator [Planctomycetota bacterium]